MIIVMIIIIKNGNKNDNENDKMIRIGNKTISSAIWCK